MTESGDGYSDHVSALHALQDAADELGILDADAAVKNHVLEGLAVIRGVISLIATLGDGALRRSGVADEVSQTIAHVQTLPSLPDDTFALLDFDGQLLKRLGRLAESFHSVPIEASTAAADGLREQYARIRQHVERAHVLLPAFRDSVLLRLSAQDSAASAAKSAEIARDDAGEVGDVKLAAHFSDYAKTQLRASNWFRFAAFVSAAAAVAVGVWLYFHARNAESVSDHVARGLIVVALASVGTYCGRIASQHRHDGNWAATVAVQLKEFTRFMEPVTDEQARAQIQVMFASRVLGAAPASGETHSPMSADQVIAALSQHK